MKHGFGKLLLIFTIVPFVELSILLKIAEATSALTTLAIIILTGILGAYFAKDQGRRVIFNIQAELNSGRMPGNELLHGLSVLIGGVLLLTPGILTDALGFSLLLPMTRTIYIDMMKSYIKNHFQTGGIHIYSNHSREYDQFH